MAWRSTTTGDRSGWRASRTSSTGSPTPLRRPAGGSISWPAPSPRRTRGDVMKITAIESRVIGYDIAEAWGGIMPEAIHSTWYEYSFDTLHTDEGVVGYTMQNAN